MSDEQLDAEIEAVLDVLAPVHAGERIPIFELPHETTPTDEQMRELAQDIVRAVHAAASR